MNKNTWPDGTPRSTNNAFTDGYLGIPHGYDVDLPAAPAKVPPPMRLGGFAKHNGTLHGLGKHVGNFTIKRKAVA